MKKARQEAFGQRDRQMLPDGLAEAGVGDDEDAPNVDWLRAADDLGGALRKQAPDAKRNLARRGEEELGKQIPAAQGDGGSQLPNCNDDNGEQDLQTDEARAR